MASQITTTIAIRKTVILLGRFILLPQKSEYRFCKPCSVKDNYLSRTKPIVGNSILSADFPYQIWVSRLWGLPRSTLKFPLDFVTVALSGVDPCYKSLGFSPPLGTPPYLALFFTLAQSLQPSQTGRAWTFL